MMSSAAFLDTRTLIDELLAEQQSLTAVERFSLRHERQSQPAHAALYRDLLPATAPGPGEQYAFSVNLAACSGCKACVSACHSLNGLEENETWRSVGLLHGGTIAQPFQQTVTTACHHCVEPACLQGCPVLAYEKDPQTGIVRHLDDQCIGCQYCILKCPYDVPKYSSRLGIVRKCDMCSSRLAVAEAPACAQACPNEAIRIELVNTEEMRAEAAQGRFLPGAPAPDYTIPTTRYTSPRALPLNLTAVDQAHLQPAQAHPPLVFMLVLTQLSVGAFCIDTLLRALFPANLMTQLSSLHALAAMVLGLLAIAASTLHLGRPLYAWRAVIGFKTSWLSREILLFGIFAVLAVLEACSFWLKPMHQFLSIQIATGVSLAGLSGVTSSWMVYHDTRRPLWSGSGTAAKFFGTTALLGTATVLFITTLQALVNPAVATNGAYRELTTCLTAMLAGVTVIKLITEALIFLHVRRADTSPLKGTALLLLGELAEIATARLFIGLLGGVILPLAFLFQHPSPGFAMLGVTFWIMLCTLLGELLERHLFFVSVSAPRMPGGV